MSAAEKRKTSGDPLKRLTYRYQYWLAAWRGFGGTSDNEVARYYRQKLKEVRKSFKRS